jgi:hypothetical protein
MTHVHTHSHAGGAEPDRHHHDPAAPHPPQPIGWSVFRMALTGRIGAAVAVAVCLWAIVLLAMRPT